MEATTAQYAPFILTTFNDGKTNKFHDSTFRLRPPFKPNANGQYKVTINECLFENNEPTLAKDVDWFKITVHKTDGTSTVDTFTIIKDIFTNSIDDDKKIIQVFTSSATGPYTTMVRHESTSDPKAVYSTDLFNTDTEDAYTPATSTLGISMTLRVRLAEAILLADVKNIELTYSTNFGYLFNDLRVSPITAEPYDASTTHNHVGAKFNFINPNRGGPILYILKTPLKATAPTYNAVNQGYNIVACAYNQADFHNSLTQLPSSMEVVCNDLSNLRIELVNDQYEHVKIRSPMYLHITVSNE